MIRSAAKKDAADILAIHKPIVRDTPISFETEPPSEEEMAARIAQRRLVATATKCSDHPTSRHHLTEACNRRSTRRLGSLCVFALGTRKKVKVSMLDNQIERLLDIVRDVLGEDVVGVYLFGSAVLGGLKPHSDLDVMVVSRRRTTRAEKERLVSQLLPVSGTPRHVEVTIVVESEVRPWRYPPRMDFQYGDWWRDDFERGELEPWDSETNPDLASLIRMVLLSNTPLQGPPPSEIFEPVPRGDYVAALVNGIDELLQDIESDTHNVVLALARIWSGIVTDEIRSKDAAADWALPRLPAQHRGVLEEARAIYLGDQEEGSEAYRLGARAYAEHLVAEILALSRSRF